MDVLGHSRSVRTEPTPEPHGGFDTSNHQVIIITSFVRLVGLCMFVFVCTSSICLQIPMIYH